MTPTVVDRLPTIAARVHELRARINQNREELSAARGHLVPREELPCRLQEWLAAKAARVSCAIPANQIGRSIADLLRDLGRWDRDPATAQIDLHDPNDLLAFLSVFVEFRYERAQTLADWNAGAPAAERPETILRLEAEALALEREEESLIDSTNQEIDAANKEYEREGLGVTLSHLQHRGDVTQRRQSEARARELAEKARAGQATREDAINARRRPSRCGECGGHSLSLVEGAILDPASGVTRDATSWEVVKP